MTSGDRPNSRTGRFVWSIGLQFANQGVSLVVGLWLTRYLVRELGESAMGWWTGMLLIVGYLTVTDFGIGTLLPRQVARAVGRAGGVRSAADLPDIIAPFVKFSTAAVFPVALLASVALFSLPVIRAGDTHTSAAVVAIAVLLYPLRTGAGILIGLQDVRWTGVGAFTAYLIGAGATVACVRSGWGASSLAIGWAVQAVLGNAVAWTRLYAAFPGILPRTAAVAAAKIPRRMVADGGLAWAATVGATFASTAEILCVGALEPAADLFRYACTTKLIAIAAPLTLILFQSVLPGLVELRESGSGRTGTAFTAYAHLTMALSGAMGCAIVAANAIFVTWWVGAERYLGDVTSIAAVAGMSLRHVVQVLAAALYLVGRERALWYFTFADGVAAVAATAAWVVWGGEHLAPFGPLTAAIAVILPGLTVVAYRADCPGLSTVLIWVAGWAILYACAAAAGFALASAIGVTGIAGFAGAAAVAGLIYGVAVAGFGYRSPAAAYFKSQLTRSVRP